MRFGTRELLFVMVLLGMLAAAYFLVLQPRTAARMAALQEIQDKQGKLAQLEAETRKIRDLGAEIERTRRRIELSEQKLPTAPEMEVILRQISELATAHKLTPKSIKTDKTTPTATYTELPIPLVIVGDFDAFYGFLLDVEKLQRIIRMPEMKLKKTNQEGQVEATMVLDIYFNAQTTTRAEPGKGRV